MDMLEKIKHAAAFIDGRTSGFRPEVGIILGTGLGGLVDHIAIRHSIEYADIPDFPVSTVEGHKGRLIFGELGGRRIVAMQGRFHYYEGYTPQQVVFPVRVMKFLGIARLFVSNASGGTNPTFRVGDLMVIRSRRRRSTITCVPSAEMRWGCPLRRKSLRPAIWVFPVSACR